MTKIPLNIIQGKIGFRILNILAWVFIILPFLGYLIFRSPSVQTYATSLITRYLENELTTTVRIGGVDLSPSLQLILDDVFIADQQKDTLLYSRSIHLNVGRFSNSGRLLHLKNIRLTGANIRLNRPKSGADYNYQFLIDYFSSTDTVSSGKPAWKIRIHAVDIENTRFQYHIGGKPAPKAGMDYNDLVVRNINLSLRNIHFEGDTLKTRIENLSASEKCGFYLENLSGEAAIAPDRWQIQNLHAKTDLSDIDMEELIFRFNSLADFSDFIPNVRLEARIRSSKLHSADLVHFAPQLQGMNERVQLKGNAKGTIAQLRIRDFQFAYGEATSFTGNVRLNGLPNIEETFIQLDTRDLTTNPDDLAALSLPGGDSLKLPELMKKFGEVRIKGNFTGFYNDFVAYANFQTALGSIKTDLSVKNELETGKIFYQGKLDSRGFDLGQLINLPANVGKLNLSSEIAGSGLTLEDLDVRINGILDSLDLQGNIYRMVSAEGDFRNKRFTGHLGVRDETIDLDLDGYTDFSGTAPVFNFVSSIRHANLNRLKLIRSDSAFVLNTDLNIQLSGIEPDSMTGTLAATQTTLLKNAVPYRMEHLDLRIKPVGKLKYIELLTDFLNLEAQTSVPYHDIPQLVMTNLRTYFPSLKTEQEWKKELAPDQWINLSVNLKNTALLTKVLLPGVQISNSSVISAYISNTEKTLRAEGRIPGIMINSMLLEDFTFELKPDTENLRFTSGLRHLKFNDSIGMDSLVLTAGIENDSIRFFIDWNNEHKSLKNRGDIQGYLSMNQYPAITLSLFESNAYINDSLWHIPGTNRITFEKNSILVQNFSIQSGDQIINLNGLISDNPLDHMVLDLRKFNLNNLDLLTRSIDFNFDGILSGRVEVSNLYQTPNLISNLHISNLVANADKLGDADIVTVWNPATSSLATKAEVIYKGNIGENRPIAVQGYFYPESKDSSLDFTIEVANFKLKTISNFLSSFSSDVTGRANGKLRLLGSLKQPSLVGTLAVNRAEMLVDYLNVSYSFSHDIRFDKNLISIDNMTVYDSIGNKSQLNAKIRHTYFRDFNLDIDIVPDKLLALNTDFVHNELFYGKAFGSGKVKISGPVTNLKMDIMATTEKGTSFYVPINTSAELGNNNFITFVEPARQDTQKSLFPEYQADLSGIDINLDLRATQDAFVKIFMPEGLGSISANGDGNIRMNVNTRGEFDIYGVYQIRQGDFNFTLQNVIQRHFNIQQGSKITFNGSPYDAQVDINATYAIDVPLSGLNVQNFSPEYAGAKAPVNCVIDLKGSLFNPDILFRLRLKDNNPEINRLVFTQIDTNNQQQMAEQMIFLLVLRQFKPLDRNNNINIGTSVGNSSWELVSNQLSSWLSQISKDFDIGVNYKPGDKLTSDEISVALSTQLFNERLIIDGNIGVQGNNAVKTTNQNPSNFVGDVNVEYKLTRDGRFRVKAYNRSNNMVLLEDNAPYTQGLGLFYRKEFDYFSDLFKRKSKKPVVR